MYPYPHPITYPHHHHPHYNVCVPYDDTAVWRAIEDNEDALAGKVGVFKDKARGYSWGEVDGIRSAVDWAIMRNDTLKLVMIKVNPLRSYDYTKVGGYDEDHFETGIRLKVGTNLDLTSVPSSCLPAGGTMFTGSHVVLGSDASLYNMILKISDDGILRIACDPVTYYAEPAGSDHMAASYTIAHIPNLEVSDKTSSADSALCYYGWDYMYFNEYL